MAEVVFVLGALGVVESMSSSASVGGFRHFFTVFWAQFLGSNGERFSG